MEQSIIKSTIQEMLNNKEPITNVQLVAKKVNNIEGIEVSNDQIK